MDTRRCPYCAEEILAAARKCKHCHEYFEAPNEEKGFEEAPNGEDARLTVDRPVVDGVPMPESHQEPEQRLNSERVDDNSVAQPSHRFAARIVDAPLTFSIGSIAIVAPLLLMMGVSQEFLIVLAEEMPGSKRALEFWPFLQVVYFVMFPVAAAFVEASLIVIFGNTPGKALTGLRIVTPKGESLDFLSAFKRTVKLWYLGLAGGFPLLAFFTMCKGYADVEAGSATLWDRDVPSKVQRREVASWRKVTFAILFFAVLLMTRMH